MNVKPLFLLQFSFIIQHLREENTNDNTEVESYDDFDDSEDESMEMASLLLIMRRRRKIRGKIEKKPRRAPRFWIRQIFLLREEYDEYHRLIQELRGGDREYFFR